MRARLSIIGIGIVILAFGTIFYLQGNSVIGPGVAVLAVGIWLSLRRPRS